VKHGNLGETGFKMVSKEFQSSKRGFPRGSSRVSQGFAKGLTFETGKDFLRIAKEF